MEANSEKQPKKLNNFTSKNNKNNYFFIFIVSLLAGGFAGVVVDIGLFPVDTIKTRIQSTKSAIQFSKKNIFKGVTSTLLGSFPSAATFFISYDYTNKYLKKCKNIIIMTFHLNLRF